MMILSLTTSDPQLWSKSFIMRCKERLMTGAMY